MLFRSFCFVHSCAAVPLVLLQLELWLALKFLFHLQSLGVPVLQRLPVLRSSVLEPVAGDEGEDRQHKPFFTWERKKKTGEKKEM